MRTALLIILATAAVLAGCARTEGVLFQSSTIAALSDGVFDGDISVGQILQHGDFGLGTFRSLDGEMIVTGGRVYQVPVDGHPLEASAAAITPFAAVVRFRAEKSINVETPLNLASLQRLLDSARQTANVPYAVRVHGQFKLVRTRSVPAQTEAGKTLADAVKQQTTFDLPNIAGEMVGFWFPEQLSAVNVPGYHFHFISNDREHGGHVLEGELLRGQIELMPAGQLQIRFPQDEQYQRATLKKAAGSSLQGIE